MWGIRWECRNLGGNSKNQGDNVGTRGGNAGSMIEIEKTK